ncbi:DUF1543 domain-containing protein [Pseudoalteromonas fenneropenaei]|uniref:DUF1543 domain-containing protein n=1 Tax=Pseudoalteromonas fenneropenaei TaxID=1737459 RepID=A0ABV7CH98_9GAMM
MKLFMVYLGGRVAGCHIEMHDVRFVIAERIEDAYAKLKAQWVGDKNAVHMDSYVEVKHADGFDIVLSTEPKHQTERLFFVNLGGYKAESLAEQHEFALFVADSEHTAKDKAKAALLVDTSHQHKDNLHDVDDCFAVDLLDERYHIHLIPSGKTQQLKPDWFGYHIL